MPMSSATSLLATAGVWNQGAVDLYLEPPANISSQTAQNPQGQCKKIRKKLNENPQFFSSNFLQ